MRIDVLVQAHSTTLRRTFSAPSFQQTASTLHQAPLTATCMCGTRCLEGQCTACQDTREASTTSHSTPRNPSVRFLCKQNPYPSVTDSVSILLSLSLCPSRVLSLSHAVCSVVRVKRQEGVSRRTSRLSTLYSNSTCAIAIACQQAAEIR